MLKEIRKEDARPGDWANIKGRVWVDMERIAEIKDVDGMKVIVLELGAVHRYDNGEVLKGVKGRRIIGFERGEI